MDYSYTVEQINRCFHIIYKLKKTPIYVTTHNCGIIFNLGVEHINECWWIVIRTDDLLDLMHVSDEGTGIICSGDEQDLIREMNNILSGKNFVVTY